jgi:aminopeptidase N
MTFEYRHHARCACGSALSSASFGAARPFVLAGTKRVYERSRPFTIRHIAIVLELDLEK